MRYLIAFLLMSYGALTPITAQDCAPLPASNTAASLLGGLLGEEEQRITGACQMASGEDYLTARVEYAGFDDKEYRLIGRLLGPNRQEIPGCPPVVLSLKGRPNSANLTFRFDAAAREFAIPTLDVRYLKVTIVDGEDPLADLNLGGISLTGTTLEYRVDHRFSTGVAPAVDPAEAVTVSIGFTPVGQAATIKQ